MEAFYRLFLSVSTLRCPSVAVVHGAAVGAGLCFAAACDLRIAATEAKLGANFVRVGLHPGMGCTLLLPHLVGEAKARELLLTGALIDGSEAARIGLVNRAVPRDHLEEAVAETADQLATAAPIAVAQTKSTLNGPLLARLEETLARESLSQAISFSTEDLKEAVSAFRNGRKPAFAGL
jgi:enoyl-CoA hydratase